LAAEEVMLELVKNKCLTNFTSVFLQSRVQPLSRMTCAYLIFTFPLLEIYVLAQIV